MKRIFLSTILFSFFSISMYSQLVEIERLEFVKNNQNTVRNAKPALAFLLREAEKELNVVLTPVVEKTIIAASGDKHDYVSMGPYWWPDPSKLNGLPYIRRDGERNPETYTMDRDKLRKLNKNISTLAYAYFFTNDERFAEKAVNNLRFWFLNDNTKMNPNLNYGQMIPGHNEGKGRGAGMIDVYSFMEMIPCINILASSKSISEKDMQGLKKWFRDFLDWMMTSEVGQHEYNARNNHGVAFDVQAVAYAIFSDQIDVAQKLIEEFPDKRIFTQIEPDGSQPLELARTLAFHYTIFNLKHFLDMATLAKSQGIDLFSKISDDGRSITKAIDFAKEYLGKEQSAFPYKQIKDWGINQERLCWTLRRATLFQPNEEYDALFDEYCTTKDKDLYWLFYAK